jgi:hypothetical protein
MRRRIGLIFPMFAAALLTLPTRDVGATVEISNFRLRDKSLNAVFETADGCFVATTTLRFAASVTQIDGPPVVAPPLTQVEVDYSNGCTGEFFSLSGGTNTQIVNIAQDLSSATLSAIVSVTDGVVNANVTVNARFTANGPLQEVKDHSLTRDGNTITFERFDVKVRSADMTGTSLSTVLPLQAGPTFLNLSEVAESGQMGKDLFGTRTVTFLHGHGHP